MKNVELIMGFVSSSLKQKRHNFTVANHMSSRLFARWGIAKHICGVFARPRNNRRSSKPRVRVLFAGEEVARKRSGGKWTRRTEEKKEMKRKQKLKRKKKETKERRKTEKGGEGEHLTGNIYTVYELAGARNRRGATRRTRGRRGRPRIREGRAHESKTVAVYGRFYGVTHREEPRCYYYLSWQ